MEQWKEYRLGDIVNLVIDYRGKTPLKLGGSWSQNGYRALSAKNIKTGAIVNEDSIRFVDEELYRRWMKDEVQRGDIFVTSEAPFGQIYYWNSDEKIVLSQRLFCLRLSEEVCSKFVYYYMITNTFQAELDGRATGTTVIGLRQPELLKCKINLPSLAEQQRIASILSPLDEKIEVNRRINSNLEEQAKALFKSWFIDFEPFKGGKFVDSELGKIPEGWKVVNLLDVSLLFDKRRKPLSGQQREKMEKLYPYYGATSIMDYVDDYIFNGVYLLMGEDGSVVKSNGSPYLQYVYGKFWSNNHAHVMQGKNGYSTEMLWCLLSLTNVSSIVTGAVQGKISQQSMQMIMIPLPTQAVCERFNIILNPIFAEIRSLSESSMRLSALRDALLPKLMSGEIEVSDINL